MSPEGRPKFLCGMFDDGGAVCADQCARCLAAEACGETTVPRINHEAPVRTADVQTVDGKTQQIPVEPPKPAVLAELHVVLFADGNFQVNGPIDNPFHYHGLLGIAADALRDVRAKQAASRLDLSAGKRGPGFLRKLLAGRREAQGILKKES